MPERLHPGEQNSPKKSIIRELRDKDVPGRIWGELNEKTGLATGYWEYINNTRIQAFKTLDDRNQPEDRPFLRAALQDVPTYQDYCRKEFLLNENNPKDRSTLLALMDVSGAQSLTLISEQLRGMGKIEENDITPNDLLAIMNITIDAAGALFGEEEERGQRESFTKYEQRKGLRK